MILIMKILLLNEYKIINLWYPTYVYQFFNFKYVITKIKCWPLFKQDPLIGFNYLNKKINQVYNSSDRRGISSSTDDEIFSYSATDKIYIENASLTDNEKKSFHKSSKILPSGFKFSSLHAPYSQFVIKVTILV